MAKTAKRAAARNLTSASLVDKALHPHPALIAPLQPSVPCRLGLGSTLLRSRFAGILEALSVSDTLGRTE